MPPKPWFKVVTPREDLRESRPVEAAEFAVNLDHLREDRAPPDYLDPKRFFARTYLTENLRAIGASVLARLAGSDQRDAIYNLSTQFGGGKTHALAMLFHLARSGPASQSWQGVDELLRDAQIARCPKSEVAAFVGTEFGATAGRGGSDGTPLRRTPWGEIAWQLGGAESFAVVAGHDEAGEAPAGDTIRAMLPKDRPSLILVDELMSFVGRCIKTRHEGLIDQTYHFLQSLSEVARGRSGVVLVASIQASEEETSVGAREHLDRFQKMLNRLGRSVLLSSGAETSHIIRRRLFDWTGLPPEGRETALAYADWLVTHRTQLPTAFAIDLAAAAVEETYPFHPALLSVFERKWRGLPHFQQTRGVLKLLALWVGRSYSEGFKRNTRELLISLGSAPFDDLNFRQAVFDELGDKGLEVAVTSDIVGNKDSVAMRLDQESADSIRKAKLHQRVAAAVFFESNGGTTRNLATLPELRLAVGEPTLDIGNVETVLDDLATSCFYFTSEISGWRFSAKPNVNKLLADRRASVAKAAATRVRDEVRKVFGSTRGSGTHVVFFPEKSADIPDRAALTYVVAAPESDVVMEPLAPFVIEMTRTCGTQARAFKNALVWVLPTGASKLEDEARTLLAWEAIDGEQIALGLDEAQRRQVSEGMRRSARDLRDAIWRAYRHVALLARVKDDTETAEQGAFRVRDLGLANASAAESLLAHVQLQLLGTEIEKAVGTAYLTRHWPPALTEWSTRGVHDAFFASPRFPRLVQGEAVKDTIAKGVTDGSLALVTKSTTPGRYETFRWNASTSAQEIEFSDEVYVITRATAEAWQRTLNDEKRAREAPPLPKRPSSGGTKTVETQPPEGGATPRPEPPAPAPSTTLRALRWTGDVPAMKYTNLYRQVLMPLGGGDALRLTVTVEFKPAEGFSRDKLEEVRAALRALGLSDDVKTE